MIIKPGKELDVNIEDVAFGGKGVARIAGLVCFISGTITGEKVKIRVTSVRKTYLEAELIQVMTSSPARVEAECKHFGQCGGCQYQHIDYTSQIELKKSQLKQTLIRIGGFQEIPALSKVVSSPEAYHYRNKITFSARKTADGYVTYGYRGGDNNHLIEIDHCPLAREEVNELIPRIKRTPWGKKNRSRDKPKSATLRATAGDEPIIYYGAAPAGMPWRKESVNGREFRVPLGSFYQVNPQVAEELFNTVVEWVDELSVSSVIDAFCGAGFLSMGLTNKAVIGVEIDPKSIDAARYNARSWGLKSSEYIAGDANKLINQYLSRRTPDTLVILNPPRGGCGESCVTSLKKHQPAWILYVSCDPATFARDLKNICQAGDYQMAKLALFDMFPQTAHFESMVLLKKV